MMLALLECLTISACATAPESWQRASVPGAQLAWRSHGSGQPVVFVHAGVFAGWFEPLLREEALAHDLRLVTYQRAGYGNSSRIAGVTSIAQQAAQLNALLRQLGIERAHLVGHSSGALIALQLALEAPERVQSLVLLEPALSLPSTPGAAADVPAAAARPGIGAALQRYRAGDKQGAVDGFMRLVAGDHYRSALDAALPRAFAHAIEDADTFFGQELPAVRAWSFGAAEARRITQPVLAVMGERSPTVDGVWQRRQQWITTSMPQAEAYVLPGATHLLHLQNPGAMAGRLAQFLARHRIESR